MLPASSSAAARGLAAAAARQPAPALAGELLEFVRGLGSTARVQGDHELIAPTPTQQKVLRCAASLLGGESALETTEPA